MPCAPQLSASNVYCTANGTLSERGRQRPERYLYPVMMMEKCWANVMPPLPVMVAASFCSFTLSLGPVLGAEVVRYTVEIAPTGIKEVDQALTDTSDLVRLCEAGPVDAFGLIIRAQNDTDRLGKALGGLGYYSARLDVTIAMRALDDPTLPRLLDESFGERPVPVQVPVQVAVAPGPLFHLGRVELRGAMPDRARAEFKLAAGAPADAGVVLAAQARLLAALREDGFALARVDPPIAELRPRAELLDVTLRVDTGPRVNLGPIAIKGLDGVNESFIRRRLQLHSGERFAPSRITAARDDLLNLGVFSSVRICPPERTDVLPDGTLPLTVDIAERPRHVVNFSAAWSTDLGGDASASWQHRNLFGNAEQLKISAGVNNLGGTAARAPGYNVAVQFIKPDFLAHDQSLQVDVGAVRQQLDAYTQTAGTLGVVLNRTFPPHWGGSIGTGFTQERIVQRGVTRDYALLDLPIVARYDSTRNLLDPTRGCALHYL